MKSPRRRSGYNFALTNNNDILVHGSNSFHKIISGDDQRFVEAIECLFQSTHPECHGSRLFLSPALPSTVIYPSPLSAVMKTIAVSA